MPETELDRRLRTYLEWIERTRPTDATAYSHNPELYFIVYERHFVELTYPPYPAILTLTPDGEDFIIERVMITKYRTLDYRKEGKRRNVEFICSCDFPRWVGVDVDEIIEQIVDASYLYSLRESTGWTEGDLKTIEGDPELVDDIEVSIEYIDHDYLRNSWTDSYIVKTIEIGIEKPLSAIRKDLLSSAIDVASTGFKTGLKRTKQIKLEEQ